ncbi:ABC transporter substrate-binding protein [Thalassotalea profundi]|uniref:ABC transporter substrate-binding protein n=1 Tax=Thalassotalea profundi TaxID=2036687 RepID=UPI001E3A92D4|nr:ABC transporter substrate-binding protein [Thalassotalea profundi]
MSIQEQTTVRTLFALLSFLSLYGCGYDENISLNNKSIVYCSEGVPEGFNPQTVTSGVTIDVTSNQLYNRLITYDKDETTIIPALAKSWHVTKDGKKVTFYLRRDVNFHQTNYFTPTRTLNSDDVIFSFERILNSEHPYYISAGGKFPFFQSVEFGKLINNIERINDYTVRFNLNQADSTILANLASDFAIILSKEYADTLAQYNFHTNIDSSPIGTGPFKLKSYRAGSYIKYVPHESYWGNKSTIEQLIFDITPNSYTRLTKLLAKECDIISYPIAHEKIDQRPDLTLDEKTSFNIGYLGFNTQKPPFNNKVVRKAIAHAINKQAILETVYFSQAENASTIIPKTSWAYDSTIQTPEYSIEQAKKLLAQAGFEGGFEMDLWAMPVQRPYNPDARTMAKLIQADLAKVNIKVNIIRDYEWSKFLGLLAEGRHQSVLLGWSADHPDPDNFFTPLLSCASALTGNNRTFWCNGEFDNILANALLINDIAQRKRYYKEALSILADEMPLIPIAHSKRYQARKKIVKGEILNAFGGIDFTNVSKN